MSQQAPPEVLTVREMTVTLDRSNRPEPDVMAVKKEALHGLDQTTFHPGDVLLAIEVVSPDSVARDRDAKPRKYAAAGIPHFWRVENEEGRAVVHVFELEPTTATYAVTGIYHDRLKLTVPFTLDIGLSDLGPVQR